MYEKTKGTSIINRIKNKGRKKTELRFFFKKRFWSFKKSYIWSFSLLSSQGEKRRTRLGLTEERSVRRVDCKITRGNGSEFLIETGEKPRPGE